MVPEETEVCRTTAGIVAKLVPDAVLQSAAGTIARQRRQGRSGDFSPGRFL